MRTRRSLIDLDDLSADEIEAIFEETRAFEAHAPGRLLDGVDAVNLFFEQSTRTFTSFNLAQMRLGANVVNLSPKDLSLATKGETVEDTMLTLSAMGIGVIVIRHPEAGFPARMAAAFDGHVIKRCSIFSRCATNSDRSKDARSQSSATSRTRGSPTPRSLVSRVWALGRCSSAPNVS
jgi:hypothetical protein